MNESQKDDKLRGTTYLAAVEKPVRKDEIVYLTISVGSDSLTSVGSSVLGHSKRLGECILL